HTLQRTCRHRANRTSSSFCVFALPCQHAVGSEENVSLLPFFVHLAVNWLPLLGLLAGQKLTKYSRNRRRSHQFLRTRLSLEVILSLRCRPEVGSLIKRLGQKSKCAEDQKARFWVVLLVFSQAELIFCKDSSAEMSWGAQRVMRWEN
ncbi:hypothetical protein BaRGS_00002470, partial [Batillaria attramentaria]